MNHKVKVKILNSDWLLLRQGNFANFSSVLGYCSSQRIYETDFMKVLVDANWVENQNIILKYCFYPWMIYSIAVVFYLHFSLKN